MQYLVSFLEGIITFISPCLLPMLPVYLTYFAGGGQRSGRRTLAGAVGFVAGFTLVFMAMGLLAGTFGSLLRQHQTAVNLVTGLVVVLFGLSFLGVFRLPQLHLPGLSAPSARTPGFLSSLVFGVVFSLGWTPCVGAFLGSALMLAGQQGHALTGLLMLLAYSLGLGIPFLLSAVLIDRLRSSFQWIKAHYAAINALCGGLLVVMGLLMASGIFGRFLALFS